MRFGPNTPTANYRQRIRLLQLLLLCVLGCLELTPVSAHAARSIPMCSVFAECAEAPPPGTTPTGGEMRARQRNPFEHGPSLDRAPNNDAPPLLSQLAHLEPLALIGLDELGANGLHVRGSSPRHVDAEAAPHQGVRREVFRPPCDAA